MLNAKGALHCTMCHKTHGVPDALEIVELLDDDDDDGYVRVFLHAKSFNDFQPMRPACHMSGSVCPTGDWRAA